MSEEQFFSLTPRKLHALRARAEQRQERQDVMLAQLTSCMVNFSYRAPQKPTTWQDFMPGEKYRKRTAKPKRMTASRRRKIVADLRMMFPKV